MTTDGSIGDSTWTRILYSSDSEDAMNVGMSANKINYYQTRIEPYKTA